MLPRWLLLICFCIFFQWNTYSTSAGKMKVVHEWKYIDYDFGSKEKREQAIKSGEYDYTKASPLDVDKWKDLTFVTVTRAKGVPASLNVITDKKGPGGPLLKPYPDWSWAKLGDCDSLTNVYRVAIDKCDRLWVLDSGKIFKSPGNYDSVCQPQLLTFDLNTSKLLKRIKIPWHIAENTTIGQGLLVTPVLDAKGEKCENTKVYIADCLGYAVIYYDDKNNFFKRLTSWAFDYDPRYTKFTIEGESFTLKDGPMGMALSQDTNSLYFSPLSSHTNGDIPIKRLEKSKGEDLKVYTYVGVLDTQQTARAITKSGVLFSGHVVDTSIGCWYEHNKKTKDYTAIAVQDSETLEFISGMKPIEGKSEELWVLSNRYQKVATGTINYHETNFRILKATVEELVKGTVCEPK